MRDILTSGESNGSDDNGKGIVGGSLITVYDTSGPYTDENVEIDLRRGLSPIRSDWIAGRGDVETYEGRDVRPEDNGYTTKREPMEIERFPVTSRRQPLRAKAGHNVTQMHYARRGIITQEMEFVLEPGDVLYVPPGKFHNVRNTHGPRVSFSIPFVVYVDSKKPRMDRTYIPFRAIFEDARKRAEASIGDSR